MNIFWQTFKFVFKDLIGNILFFPFWWYSVGAFNILKKIGSDVKSFAHSMHLGVLFKYLFKPMYGMTDITSRVISIIVRIVHFSILFVITSVWVVVLFIGFLIWLAFPIFVAYNIIFQLGITDYNLGNIISQWV